MLHTDKPKDPCGSSFVDLRDFFTLWIERLEIYFNRRFDDLDARTALVLASADKALTKAEIASEKRFESVNEFREQQQGLIANFLTRVEYEGKHEGLVKQVDTLSKQIQERRNELVDRGQQSSEFRQGWVIPMIVVGLLAAGNLIINLVVHLPK